MTQGGEIRCDFHGWGGDFLAELHFSSLQICKIQKKRKNPVIYKSNIKRSLRWVNDEVVAGQSSAVLLDTEATQSAPSYVHTGFLSFCN